jgi:tetratricopeptide (TPR) repeat protein
MRGPSRLVLISGEAGVGKTRMAAELACRLHADGATVLAGSCSPEPVGAYQPIREALRAYLSEAGAGVLAGVSPERAAALGRLLPDLAPAASPGNPELVRLVLFDAVVAVLGSAGAGRPALLIVDDAHWADGATAALLRHLLRTAPARRLLVVATVTVDELGEATPLRDTLSDLSSAGLVDRLDVGGLDVAGVRRLVESRAGHELDAGLGGLVDELHRVTEGNPFFVIQLLRHLLDTGRLQVEDGRWRWTGDHPILGPAPGLPLEVREVVGRRLGRLGVEDRALLRAAAVLGMAFDLERAGAIAGLDAANAAASVEQAVALRVVAEVPGASDRYRFAHAMFREAVYDTMSATRRQRLHQRAAAGLQAAAAGDGVDAAEIANHLLAASAAVGPAELCDAVLAAGRQAFERTDYESAAALCTRALAVLGGRIDDRHRAALIAMRAEARLFTSEVAEAREDVVASARLAEAAGDIATMSDVLIAWCRTAPMLGPVHEVLALGERALAALGPDEEVRRARLMGALCHQLVYAEPLPAIERRALEAYRLARLLDDREAIGHAATAYRLVADHRPLSERRTDVLDAIAEVAEAGDPHPGRLLLGQHRLIHAMEAGDRPGFDAALADYASLADELHFPLGLATALRARAAVALAEGRLTDAEAMGARAFEITPYSVVSYSSLLFVLYRELDRLAEVAPAVPEFIAQFPDIVTFRVVALGIDHELGGTDAVADGLRRLAADGFRSVDGALAMRANVAVLSELVAVLDERVLARPLLDLFREWGGQNLSIEEYVCLGASDRYLGQLETVLGRFDAATARLERAIAFDEAFGSTLWAAYGRLALAAALSGRGAPGDHRMAARLRGEAAADAERSGSIRLARLVDASR